MPSETSTSAAWDSQLLAALTAFKNGDFSVRLPTSGQGTTADQIAETYNATVNQINSLVSESIRIVREVGAQGKYGGQAMVEGLDGRWAILRDEVNKMGIVLTCYVRDAGRTLDGLAKGQPAEPMTFPAEMELQDLKESVNQLVARLGTTQTAN